MTQPSTNQPTPRPSARILVVVGLVLALGLGVVVGFALSSVGDTTEDDRDLMCSTVDSLGDASFQDLIDEGIDSSGFNQLGALGFHGMALDDEELAETGRELLTGVQRMDTELGEKALNALREEC